MVISLFLFYEQPENFLSRRLPIRLLFQQIMDAILI